MMLRCDDVVYGGECSVDSTRQRYPDNNADQWRQWLRATMQNVKMNGNAKSVKLHRHAGRG